MKFLLVPVFIATASCLSFINEGNSESSYFPTIGILSTPIERKDVLANSSYTMYFPGSYVDHIESAGIRPVSILYNSTYEEIDCIMSKVNGILFTGGRSLLVYYDDAGVMKYSKFMRKVMYIIQKAIEKNDNGIYFPIFGTCLGFEVLFINTVNEYILESFNSTRYRTNLFFSEKATTSKILKNAPPELLNFMSMGNITFENHNKGISPTTYLKYPQLQEMFEPIAYSKDRQGLTNIVLAEGKKYPFYGFMFHPEKSAYEFFFSTINHDIRAIEMGHYFARFFAEELSKNPNRFLNDDDYINHSLQSYDVMYLHNPYEEIYLI
ncbi:unnamed protein product [Blepharisma stoltei]|uniref:folate gamma-glutamyl hydrolase n=1 Tax=Blepharisma stoltei TaxID=1481888 RepID=A0AAU9J920_9CILI|nr:unnamed protein product [Blepharisma stoltei]